MPMASSYIPLKRKTTIGHLIFSGGIEIEQWYEMGQRLSTKTFLVPWQLKGIKHMANHILTL